MTIKPGWNELRFCPDSLYIYMNKLIILCKEDELKPIKDLIDKNFSDKDIQVYTDIKDVPEGVRDMVVSNNGRRVNMHFNDEAEFRKTAEHLMRKLTEEQKATIEDIVQEYQNRIEADMTESLKQVAEKYLTPVVDDTASLIKAEKERRKKDQKQQNKYALKYANKHYKK